MEDTWGVAPLVFTVWTALFLLWTPLALIALVWCIGPDEVTEELRDMWQDPNEEDK